MRIYYKVIFITLVINNVAFTISISSKLVDYSWNKNPFKVEQILKQTELQKNVNQRVSALGDRYTVDHQWISTASIITKEPAITRNVQPLSQPQNKLEQKSAHEHYTLQPFSSKKAQLNNFDEEKSVLKIPPIDSEQNSNSLNSFTENEFTTTGEITNEDVIRRRKLEREKYGEPQYVDYTEEESFQKELHLLEKEEERSRKKTLKSIKSAFTILEGIAEISKGLVAFGKGAAGAK